MIQIESAHLAHRITSPLLPGTGDTQPQLPPMQTGLVIAAEQIASADETLTFRLLVSYELPTPLYRAFRQPTWAVHVALECPETGQAATFALQDPYAEYAPLAGANYRGDPPPVEEAGSSQGVALALDLAVPLPEGDAPFTLYLTAHLQGLVSNRLAVDARSGVATSTEGA